MTAHDILEQARNTSCICGAPPGCPCVCEPGHYYLARVACAAREGRITGGDFASLVWGNTFYGMDTVTDPGGAA